MPVSVNCRPIITAQCTLAQSAVLRSHVRPSVTLVDADHYRAASFDYFKNRLIDANNRLLSINRINK